MDIIEEDKNNQRDNDAWRKWDAERGRGRIFGGLFIVIIGALFLMREMGVFLPYWLFSWQMLIITIGLFIGLKHSFKSFGWIVMVLVGSAFFLKEYAPDLHVTKFFWPLAIILVGIFMIFKPKRENCEGRPRWQRPKGSANQNNGSYAQEDYLEYSAIFGSIKKNVITKTFKGGEINVVFGGGEVNLSQADFEGNVALEVNAVFGGLKLIVPTHWTVKSEIAAVMGSIEDKRMMIKDVQSNPEKVLILRGNAVFGGIDITSFS